jgi:hypothetical protein
MMGVWVVVGVLALAAATVAFVIRRHARSVEPTVREFAEFRDALSRQVAGFPGIPGDDHRHGLPRNGASHSARRRDGLDHTRQ